MARFSNVALALLAGLLLAGCGGGLRVITPEVDDVAGLRGVTAFHVKPVAYDFSPPPAWEIPAADWPTKTAEWSQAFAEWTSRAEGKPVYVLGPGAEAKEGAVIEASVTSMKLGTYTFFYNAPADIWGGVTITDAASGKVLFKGSFGSRGSGGGTDMYSYEGRVKSAHAPVARDLRWLIERQE